MNQYFQQGQQQPNAEVNILPQAEPKHDYIQPLQRPSSEPKVDESLSSYSGTEAQPSGYSNTLVNKGMAEHLVNSSQVINQTSKNYQQLMTPTSSDNSTNVLRRARAMASSIRYENLS